MTNHHQNGRSRGKETTVRSGGWRLTTPMNNLADRVALVTGGASGLGRALCEQLAADGAFALVADINTRKAEEVAAHAFQVLGELDLSDPNPPPFITFWLYSHPPLAERLVFAHTYDPWSKGESPKYVK